MTELAKFIDNIEGIEKTTKNNLKAGLNKLIHKGCNKDPIIAFGNLQHIFNIYESIENVNSKKTFLSRILSINTHYFNKTEIKLISDENLKTLNIIYKDICDLIEGNHKKQDRNLKFTLQQLIDIMNKYRENSIEYLFFACYLLIPPRRRDWGHAIFVEKLPDIIDKEKNYVVIENDKVSLYFNRPRKVKKTYIKELCNSSYNYLHKLPHLNPDKLAQLLINSYTNDKRTNVFMPDTTQWTQKTKFLKDYEDICINDFRHAFSQAVFDLPIMSEAKFEFIANDFGDSSVNTFRRYSRVDDSDVESDSESVSVIVSEKDSESVDENEYESEEEIEIETPKQVSIMEQNLLNLIELDKMELKSIQERIAKREKDLKVVIAYNEISKLYT